MSPGPSRVRPRLPRPSSVAPALAACALLLAAGAALAQVTRYSAPEGGIALSPNTTYVVVIDVSSGTDNAAFRVTASDAEDSDSESGWNTADTGIFRNVDSTGSWTTSENARKIAVYADPAPPMVSNTGKAAASPVDSGFQRDRAQQFTTGSGTGGYTLNTVALRLRSSSGTAPVYSVSIQGDSGSLPDGTSLGTLTTSATLTASYALVEFAASGSGIGLTADTDYWVVIDVSTGDINTNVQSSHASDDDAGALPGWTIASGHQTRVIGSSTWGTSSSTLSLGIAVYGTSVDQTAPAFQSATVNGTALSVTFTENLYSGSAPAGSAFALSGGQTGTGTATISGATLSVTLGAPVAPGASVTLGYTPPASGKKLQDAAGNDVATFSGQRVTNNAPAPPGTRPPGGTGGGGPPPNRAPVATADLETSFVDVGDRVEIDAAMHFRDPDGDLLRFGLEVEDDTVASVTVSGSTLRIEGLRHGETTVTVTATDTRGRSATQEFTVVVGWLVGFAEPGVAAPEGESARIEVALNRERDTDTVVHYLVQADDDPETDDADADDHDAVDGTFTIPAGETVAAFEVTIHDDEDIEPVWERFTLALQPPLAEPPAYGLSTALVTVTIEEGVCDRTKAVRDRIRRSLPCERVDPDDIDRVRSLWLREHGIGALQSKDLLGLHALRLLNLNRNALRELPEGLFAGLTSLAEVDLTENPGTPFNMVVALRRTDAALSAPGPATVVATVAEGAPFDMELELTTTDGTLPRSMTIARGSLSSTPLTVQHADAVRMEIAPPPVPAEDDCGDVVPIPCYRGLTTSAGPPIVLFREPPEVTGTPPEPAIVTNDETRIDLGELAAASDGGALTFAAYSSDTSLLVVHVEGSVLTVTSGDKEGTATVTVIATDAEGLTVAIEFDVRVEFASRGFLRGARGVLLTETARPANP